MTNASVNRPLRYPYRSLLHMKNTLSNTIMKLGSMKKGYRIILHGLITGIISIYTELIIILLYLGNFIIMILSNKCMYNRFNKSC